MKNGVPWLRAHVKRFYPTAVQSWVERRREELKTADPERVIGGPVPDAELESQVLFPWGEP